MPIDPLFFGLQSKGLPPLPHEDANLTEVVQTFAQVVDRYLAFKEPGWELKTYNAVQKALRYAIEIIGSNRPVKSIAHTDVVRFRDVLPRIPPNYSKLKQFEGMTLTEVTAQNAPGPKLSIKSQKKRLRFSSRILQLGR